uniref:Uncharacterized protein n=1 Tax=Anguilla anguilla TaxID=7936 RepID=A0A0E9QSX6_ANGAN
MHCVLRDGMETRLKMATVCPVSKWGIPGK